MMFINTTWPLLYMGNPMFVLQKCLILPIWWIKVSTKQYRKHGVLFLRQGEEQTSTKVHQLLDYQPKKHDNGNHANCPVMFKRMTTQAKSSPFLLHHSLLPTGGFAKGHSLSSERSWSNLWVEKGAAAAAAASSGKIGQRDQPTVGQREGVVTFQMIILYGHIFSPLNEFLFWTCQKERRPTFLLPSSLCLALPNGGKRSLPLAKWSEYKEIHKFGKTQTANHWSISKNAL